MIIFWKLAYKSVKEQRDQYKVELLQCKSELHHYRAELESYKTNLKQRREERESMISDYQKKLDLVHMLKDEINELKQENEKLKEELLQSDYVKASVLSDREEYKNRIIELTKENKALRLQADTYFDEWQSDRSLFGFLIDHNVEFSIEDHGDVKVIEIGDWTEIHIINNKYSVYHLRSCKSPIIKEFKSEKEVVNYLSNGVV